MIVLEMTMYLVLIYQLKHFIADYLLQGKYMLKKFAPGWEFVLPLAAHCAVHAVFTFAITAVFVPWLLAASLAAFDFVVHFIMDRIKASPRMLGRFTKDDPRFWWALGFDQMIHHITHYIIIYIVVVSIFLP